MTSTASATLKNDLKRVQIKVDAASWTPPSVIPPGLAAVAGKWKKMSVGVALLHTALRTRPPNSTGIHLADYWAWMRYGPAIDRDYRLGLKPSWDQVDPHQKTILSDDLGMGFTTYLLADVLGFKSFADTVRFVNVAHPGRYEFKKIHKNGKYKSPDFIAWDGSNPNRISVVECKGTQRTIGDLEDALEAGVEQKRNLLPAGGGTAKIVHQLVAGLFIPIRRRTGAVIQVRDPEYTEFAEALEGIPDERLEPAVVQIDLAKHFALMGLHSIARALATTNTARTNTLLDARINHEETLSLDSDQRDLIFGTDNLLPSDVATIGDQRVRRARFMMRCPRSLYDSLARSQNLQGTLQRLVEDAKQRGWEEGFSEESYGATLTTPLGFTLTLEYLPQ